jgi:hypothetical protein
MKKEKGRTMIKKKKIEIKKSTPAWACLYSTTKNKPDNF